MGVIKKNKNLINTIGIILITLVALYINLKDIYKDVLNSLKSINLLYIFLACLLILLYNLLDGIALVVITRIYDKTYSILKGIKNVLLGFFFSAITPFATGGQLARIYFLNKDGIRATTATSILLMNFVVYQTALLIFGITALIFKIKFFYLNFNYLFYLVILGFIVNAVVITGLILASISKKFYTFITNYLFKFLSYIRIIKDYETTVKGFKIKVVSFKKETVLLYKDKVLMIKLFVLQFLRLLMFNSIPFFVLKSLDTSISYSEYPNTVLLSVLVYNVLAAIPVPGDNGVSETTFILIYKTVFNVVLVSTSMILWRFITYYLIMIIGGIVFILKKKNRS